MDKPVLVKDEREDIQALIVTGYSDLPNSRYLFLRIDDGAQAIDWLGQIVGDVTDAKWDGPDGFKKPDWALNIGFTADGFKKLDLPLKNGFSEEFEAGIAEEGRAKRLGDTGASAPEWWEIGGPKNEPIHVLLMVQAKSLDDLEKYCNIHLELFKKAGHEVTREEGTPLRGDKEHFGFRDSISQPEIEGSPKPSPPDQACIKPGEFVLGYLNEYGIFPPTPTVEASLDRNKRLKELLHGEAESDERDFGRNGSYLVFRKLEQDVAGFRRLLRDNASTEDEQLLLGAKLMGRWQSGTPIVRAPDKDPNKDAPFVRDQQPENDFYYMEDDCDGYRCPVSSHIRRTNPRDSLGNDRNQSIKSVNRHRIIRRGVSYGPAMDPGIFDDDGARRGLLFFCINANIRGQFEFVQQTWANDPKFNGLYDDRDPIIGDNKDLKLPDSKGPWCATVPASPLRQRCSDVSRLVTVKGGAYFFLPSIAALRFLADLKK